MEIQGYENLTFLAAGGNAHVYRATREDTGETVAIKVLRSAGDETVIARFEQERNALSELEQLPNVVPVYESGFTDGGEPYLVMPLYSGGSLQQRLEESPLEWRDAIQCVQKVAAAVEFAHFLDILHLDVKPANVLLDDKGNPWLADFAISDIMASSGSLSAQKLTPAFAPPERLDGEPPSETTDIYGLAATLFALLAGKAPFFHESRTTPVSVMMAVVNDPVPVHELPGDVPGAVRNLLMRVMAKEVEKRPATVTEFISLLDDALAGNPIESRGYGVRRPELGTSLTSVPLGELAQARDDGEALRSSDEAQAVPLTPVLDPELGQSRMPLVLLAAAVTFFVVLVGGALILSLGGGSSDDVATDDGAAIEPATDGTAPPSSEAVDIPADEVFDDEDSVSDEPATESAVAGVALDEDQSESAGVVEDIAVETTTTVPDAPAVATTTTSTTTIPTTTTSTELPASTTTTPSEPILADFLAVAGPPGNEQTVTFQNVTAGDALAFQWDFGDGAASSDVSPTHTYEAPGRYRVTIVAFGLNGERDEITRPVPVAANSPEDEPASTSTTAPAPEPTPDTTDNPPSGEVFAGFIAAAGPPGDEQTLSFQNTSRGPAVRYEWNFGDGGVSSAFEPAHSYQNPGNYDVTITAFAADGTSASTTHPVRVSPTS